jgi:hypothetical protein
MSNFDALTKDELKSLGTLVSANDRTYLASLIMKMYTDFRGSDQLYITGCDIDKLGVTTNVDNRALVKELAIALGIIRPANGKNEQSYFLTLKGMVIASHHKVDEVKKELEALLKQKVGE